MTSDVDEEFNSPRLWQWGRNVSGFEARGSAFGGYVPGYGFVPVCVSGGDIFL